MQNSDAPKSHSQYGEDLRIRELLPDGIPRAAVDVGANDGQSWSNSYGFGLEGYRLLLVEPMPEYARRCRELYAGNADVIIEECAIFSTSGEQTFFINDDVERDQLAMRSSLSRELVPSSLIREIRVRAEPLEALLDRHRWPSEYAFLSIDAEGFDLDVVKTAALDRYRPHVVCIEEGEAHAAVAAYLSDVGYRFVSTHGPNGIYATERA